MKHIYDRTAKYTRIGAFVGVLAYIVFIQFTETTFQDDLANHFLTAFLFFMALGTAFFFQEAANKLPSDQIDKSYFSETFPLNELNFQKDVNIIPTSFLVSNTGERLYKIAPSKDFPIVRMLTSFSFLQSGMFFPVTYTVDTMDDKQVCRFVIKNKWKFMQLKIYSYEGEHFSTAILPLFSVRNRVIVYDGENRKMFQAEAKSVYGDIDINNLEERRLATYRFGMFPYATHPAFETQAMNVHVSLARDLSYQEKLTFTALFYYWTTNSQQ